MQRQDIYRGAFSERQEVKKTMVLKNIVQEILVNELLENVWTKAQVECLEEIEYVEWD